MSVPATPATMLIGDEQPAGTTSFDVINPATGAAFAQAPDCTRDQLDAAFDAAQRAFATWKVDDDARRAALANAARAILTRVDELAQVLTAEQGKPLRDAAREVKGAALWIRYYAKLDLPREVIQDDDAAFVEVIRKPLGVVAAITPWNFPLILAAWKIGPALRAGNTMVLKPSPFTPLSTLKLGGVLADALPPGVLNVVSGGSDLGAWMTGHPATRKISFTGSIATGKLVAAAAAEDLKRTTLELGGNDAAIVLDDADPKAIAQGLFWGSFFNSGQVCCAIKRVYAPDALYDELVEQLSAIAAQVTMGDGAAEGTALGPINNAPQFERVKDLVADALANGGTATTGGAARDGDGYFFEPTIITGVEEGTRLVDEEQFGPALPILRYSDVDEAVERANNTTYGLSGSVWGADADTAAAVAERLECGTSWVNSHLVQAPHQPFGGMKWSGIGVENGPWGLYGFTDLQVISRVKPKSAQ